MADPIDPKDDAPLLSADEPQPAAKADYEVGYKKPPRDKQWGPGESGNKDGRPRGSRSFKTELREVIEQKIPVTENGRKRTMSARQAMLVRLRQKALQGDQAATDRLLKLALDHLPDEVVSDDPATDAEDRALLEQFEADLLGRPLPTDDDDDL